MIPPETFEQKPGYLNRLAIALHLEGPLAALKAKTVPKHRASMWYVMGGLTLMFFIIQIITGLLLLFYYQPSPEHANASVRMIMTQVPFGNTIRSIHAWSANALIFMMFLHMFSVFLMKSYRSPRQILWLTGIVLLLLMLGFGFTGYLLPWDATAYFATKIGTEVPLNIPGIGQTLSELIKGAKMVGASTLTRMFALHVGVLPLFALLFVGAHVFITSLLGSSTPIGAKVKGSSQFFPSYALYELILWLIGFGLLLIVAELYPFQLGQAYDLSKPAEPPAGVHPEWYFMFLFETLRLVPEWIAVLGFTLILLFWTLVPWLDRKSKMNQKSPIFTWIGIAGILLICGLTTLAYFSVAKEQAATVSSVPGAVQDSTTR